MNREKGARIIFYTSFLIPNSTFHIIVIVGRLVAAALEAEEESPGNIEHHTS